MCLVQVPADLRVVRTVTSSVTVDQSALTGETHSVEKLSSKIKRMPTVVDQDKRNIMFSVRHIQSIMGTPCA